MKISSKRYAQLLYELTRNISSKELSKILDKFILLLQKKKQIHLKKRIFKAFFEYYNAQEDIIVVEAIFASQKNVKTKKLLKNFFSENNKRIEIREKIDGKILGGTQLKVFDTFIDASIQGRIEKMKRHLNNPMK